MSVASSRAGTAGRIALLGIPVLLAFSLPVLGFVASLILMPLAARRVRWRLWPAVSGKAALAWSVLALVGLWFPAMLSLFSQGAISLGGSVVWLLIPLCTPSGFGALIVPALAATVFGLIGALASVAARHPWPWVLGAWIAPLAYTAAALWLVDTAFLC